MYLSSLSFSIIVPPTTASIRPTSMYSTATLNPNILINSTSEPRSTSGDDMRKENVTPNGRPALVNPMNSGIEEQEQKGVTVPSNAESVLAVSPLKRPSIFLVLSGGKKLCM